MGGQAAYGYGMVNWEINQSFVLGALAACFFVFVVAMGVAVGQWWWDGHVDRKMRKAREKKQPPKPLTARQLRDKAEDERLTAPLPRMRDDDAPTREIVKVAGPRRALM